jgi:predicted solute-binding protein
MIELDESAWVEQQESAWVEQQANRIAPSEHSKTSKAIADLELLANSLSNCILKILDKSDEDEGETIENFLVDHGDELLKVRCRLRIIIDSLS